MKKFNHKIYKGIALCMVASAIFSGCKKFETREFYVDKPQSIINQEEIDAYEPLKSYIDSAANPNFKFGAAVSLSDYTQKGTLYRLLNNNFNEIVLSNGMSHSAVVQADGSLKLDNVKTLLKTASEAGMSVFGHTLCWNSNQNAAYLNSLIAPVIIPATGGPQYEDNLLPNGNFESGNISGWGGWGNSSTRAISASGQGKDGAGYAMVMTNPNVVNSWEAQTAYDFATPFQNGSKYKLSFDVKGSIAGTSSATMQDPTDYSGDDFGSFNITTGWTHVELEKTVTGDNRKRFLFSFGNYAGTIYIDNISIARYNPNGGGSSGTVLITDFENKSIGDTYPMNNGGSGTVTDDPKGVSGKVLNVVGAQTQPKFTITLPAGVTLGDCQNVTLDFLGTGSTGLYGQGMRMGVNDGAIDHGYNSPSGYGCPDGDWGRGLIVLPISNLGLTADQKKLTTFTLVVGSATSGANYYIDNIKLNWKITGDQVIEKTPEEKKTIITEALTSFISGMVDSCKNYVKAWDVVNEPMDDANPYDLKTGVGKTNMAADEFYWQDYMGQDYAVEAFKTARQHANQGDKLFINDSNLESNLDKCKGLIQYVEYIESKGAQVDGIGTQMHISTDANKDNIDEMFRLLAATGKLIRVSELDMGLEGQVKTKDATQEQYEAQEEMYKYVIEKYFELIPANQRYGITIWSPTDSPANSSWKPGEPIGLWTEGYTRKPAYMGVADGLAGK